MFLVDSHCHLQLLDLTLTGGELAPFLARAKAQAVQHILNVCVTIREFPQLMTIAEHYPEVSLSVGAHPNEEEEVELATLLELGRHHKVVAIGETGLDYYRSQGDLTWQQDRFRRHIAAAKTLQKPLIIHTREAQNDTIAILRSEKADEIGGVFHCFTEDWAMAQQALELGFYISFSGIVTFKNAMSIQEVAKKIPLERMLIETDAPYLAPVPYRGKPNEPAYVRHTAEFIAELRQESLEKIAAQTTNNFFHLFKGAVKSHV